LTDEDEPPVAPQPVRERVIDVASRVHLRPDTGETARLQAALSSVDEIVLEGAHVESLECSSSACVVVVLGSSNTDVLRLAEQLHDHDVATGEGAVFREQMSGDLSRTTWVFANDGRSLRPTDGI
jgi:hypothetical protein